MADTSHDPASIAQEANAQAVKLLQRLLRGRALQNTLSMGLANRRELVSELRTQAPPGLALAYRHTVSFHVCVFVCLFVCVLLCTCIEVYFAHKKMRAFILRKMLLEK